LQEPQPISDEALIGDLMQGELSALESLYDRHGRLLYSLALRITRDQHCAEEVVQDTFLQLWQQAYEFDTTRGPLIGWLIAITRNSAIDCLRRRKDRFSGESYDDATVLPLNAGLTSLERQIARELICAALAGLPKTQRQAIALAYFDGWTCEEIANLMGTPVGTIKTRLRCALRTMREILSSSELRSLRKSALSAAPRVA
jgi:RNA polymerase sigma-70 factor (ECF subfamily)